MTISARDAEELMSRMMFVEPSKYHKAIEVFINDHDSWTEPLIDLVLNAEDPVTFSLLKRKRGKMNALEWTVFCNAIGSFEEVLDVFVFGINNGSSLTAKAFKSVLKDLFMGRLHHEMITNPLKYELAISAMTDRDISWGSISKADSLPVEMLDREALAINDILEAMSVFHDHAEPTSAATTTTAGN